MNNFENKTLLVAGDSWTYGSEIRDPNLSASVFDWHKENDDYRLPRIWPVKLSKMFGFKDVVNLSFPAASNDRIIRHTIGWITQEYIYKNKSTEDLCVIIGLTSPERKDFYFKKDSNGYWITLWPFWKHDHPWPEVNDFSDLYAGYFCNQEESTHRYLHQIFYMQTLFKSYNINYMFFQAFYQKKDMMIKSWIDDPYTRHYNGQPDQLIWELIDPIRFVHKNDEIHSFHNYILSRDHTPDYSLAIQGQHPSELGHTWWAEHLRDYITQNKLW